MERGRGHAVTGWPEQPRKTARAHATAAYGTPARTPLTHVIGQLTRLRVHDVGARAVAPVRDTRPMHTRCSRTARVRCAHSRGPWPVRVIGRAVDVRFDVPTGVFKMTVSVGWEDRVRNAPPTEEGGEALATEVYVPLVHYAHPRLLEDAAQTVERRKRRRAWAKERADTQSVGTVTTLGDGEECDIHSDEDAARGRTRMRVPCPIGQQPLSVSMMTTSTDGTTSTATAVPSSAPPSPTDKGVALPPARADPARYSCVTTRRTSLTCRCLFPAGARKCAGRRCSGGTTCQRRALPAREYVLEVRRRGGALPSPSKGVACRDVGLHAACPSRVVRAALPGGRSVCYCVRSELTHCDFFAGHVSLSDSYRLHT